jgi:transcription initiation factor TFIIIB Brf1 subunit/transcription initiation factor TFIIB
MRDLFRARPKSHAYTDPRVAHANALLSKARELLAQQHVPAIDRHPDKAKIDALLAEATMTYREIAAAAHVSEPTIRRHAFALKCQRAASDIDAYFSTTR